ncbi:hypothetical protein [Mycolicibacterium sp. HS_4_1]
MTDLGHRCGVIRGDDKVGARIAHGWRTPRRPIGSRQGDEVVDPEHLA